MTRKAFCMSVVRTDGVMLLGTTNTRDLVVTAAGYAGTYQSVIGVTGTNLKTGSDLSVDNMEVSGFQFTFGVDATDIEAGLFDEAACVVFETDWADTSTVRVLKSGSLGQLTRDSNKAFTFEVRDKSQKLQQPLSATYQKTCRADVFSGAEAPAIARCGLDPTPYTVTGAVTSVTTPDRAFMDTSITAAAGYYTFGKLTFTSGANSGFTRGVKVHGAGGAFELVEQLPYGITIGDAYTLLPGCNKLFIYDAATQTVTGDCKVKFNNLVNFRGDPFIPGDDTLVRQQQ